MVDRRIREECRPQPSWMSVLGSVFARSGCLRSSWVVRYGVRTCRCFWSRSHSIACCPDRLRVRDRLQHRSGSLLEQIGCPCVNLAPFLQVRMTLVAGWIFCRWPFLRSMICTALTSRPPLSHWGNFVLLRNNHTRKVQVFRGFEFAFMGYYKGPFENNHAKFVVNIGQKL